MNYKTILNTFFVLLSFGGLTPCLVHGMQWPTQEQVEQTQEIYRQELERFDAMSPQEQSQYLDNMIASMSDEERQQLEELQQYFESEEFQQLYQEFADEFDVPGPPQTPALPTPPVKVETPIKSQEELNKEKEQQQTIALLVSAAERIARSIESLQVTVSAIPDFKTDVDEWAEDKEIQPWQAGMTWELFNSELQKVVQLLLKTAHYDSTHKQYPYMKHAIEKQGLRKIIEQLDQSLGSLITNLQALKGSSKKQEPVLKQLLSVLSQAIIGQKLHEQLNELVTLFAPEAQELKKQLGAQEQKALQQVRTPTRSRPIIKAGTPIEEIPYVSKPAPPARKRPVQIPPTKPKRDKLKQSGKKKSGAGGGGPSAGSGKGKGSDKKAGSGKGDSSPHDKKKKKDEGKKKDEPDKKEDKDKDKVADEFLQKLESNLVRTSAALATIDIIDALHKADINATDLSNLARQTKGLQPSIQDLRQATTQFTQRLQALSKESKKRYSDKVKGQLSISKKELDRFARAVNSQNPDTLASVKTRYVFFTEPGTDEATFSAGLPRNQQAQYNTWHTADVAIGGAPAGPERTALAQQRIQLKPVGQTLRKIVKELDSIR